VFSNSLGTGPWFDTYLGGVTPSALAPLAQQIEDALKGANP
jgi:phospholipid/cholesterol/gamma-HCH transport system substrate-binding protein